MLTPQPRHLTPPECEQLVLSHLYLVRMMARRHIVRAPKTVDCAELESIGALGLMEAAARFNPDAGVLFATFAGHRVQGAILDQMRQHGPYSREDHRRLESGEDLRPRVVFDSDIEDTRTVPPAEGPDPFLTPRLRAAVANLPRRERQIIVWRFWHGLTREQCARQLPVSESRIYQLERRALERLRDAISEEPW